MSIFKDYNPYSSWQEAFDDACRAIGINPAKDPQGDGLIHRFSSDKKNNKSCWYIVHIDADSQGGCVGDWSTGQTQNWHYSAITLTPFQKQAMIEKWQDAAKKAEEYRQELQIKAVSAAKAKWDECTPVDDSHPYLVKKGVKAHGIRKGKDRLYIPLNDYTGMVSLQSIDESGNKLFMKDGKAKGCYFILGTPKDSLYIAEGYATAASIYEGTGKPVACVFNSGNIAPAIDELRKTWPDLKLIICADNDVKKQINTGLLKAQEAGQKHSIAVISPQFTDAELKEGNPTDFNDLAALRGLPALKAIIESDLSIQQPKADLFKFLTFNDIKNLPPVTWLINKVFPTKSFGIIYGLPGKGKTFVALDMALSIASGVEWHGSNTEQGNVLYIAGEGVGGLSKRIGSWYQDKGIQPDDSFLVLPTALNLIQEQDVNKLILSIMECNKKFSLIVVDTVARSLLGGGENSSTDIGLFVKSCDAIKDFTGATVTGIHHSGKDEQRGMRGSSALLGAVDTVIRVTQEQSIVNLVMEKQKDDEPMPEKSFSMKVVSYGLNQSSVVLEATDHKPEGKKKLSSAQFKAHQILTDCISSGDLKLRGMPATSLMHWRAECYRRELTIGDNETKRKGFTQAATALDRKGVIVIENGMVALYESNGKNNVETYGDDYEF